MYQYNYLESILNKKALDNIAWMFILFFQGYKLA